MRGSQHRVMGYQQVVIANLVDAAVARPLSGDLVGRRILEMGGACSAGEASLGTKIRKSRGTTGRTCSEITQVIVMAPVSYGFNRVATFTH